MEIDQSILVVGGSGFLGSSFVKKALNHGYSVDIISKNKIALKQSDVNYIVADISDKSTLNESIRKKKYDYVVNFGGYIDHSDLDHGGQEVLEAHFLGVKNLTEFFKNSNLRGFIQIGSSDEYGSNASPIKESDRELPFSIYSFAKVAATKFLQTLYITENFPVVIVRPFLIYGPGQKRNRFLPYVIDNCLNDNSFKATNGEQIRDFCYIDDFLEALFLCIKKSFFSGEVLNIASGQPRTIKSVINQIVQYAGGGNPQFGKLDYRVGENIELYANIKKAELILDWTPKINFEDGLIRTISWYKEND